MGETIIRKELMEEIVRMIGHGYYFEGLTVFQEAIDKEKRIPKDFFEKHYECDFPWGNKWRPKRELRMLREEMISAIVKVIKAENYKPYESKMDADHYARYFHALAILKADKKIISLSKNDYMRNAFYCLWQLDDGTNDAWKKIDDASWYISEAVKGIKGLKMTLINEPED